MSYWKWLGKSLKSGIRPRTIKSVFASPIMEYYSGFGGALLFLLYGIIAGIYVDSIYYLLFLGIVPCILLALHGWYRT